jgi:hypothetical protein
MKKAGARFPPRSGQTKDTNQMTTPQSLQNQEEPLSDRERELLESRRQAARRQAMFGRPSENSADQTDDDIGTIIDFALAKMRAHKANELAGDDRKHGVPARLNGGQAPAQGEGAEDDDIHHVPVEGDTAPPLVPDDGDHGQVPEPPVQIEQRAEDSLKFLDDFFGPEKRHLVAIRKRADNTSEIKGRHFPANDRAGQQRFITDHEAAGYDIYFTVNPVKVDLHKKASKDDVAEARCLWVDMDPRKGEPLEEERAAMLALLTTNLPAGIPRPNRVIDSGRGYWGFWSLETPHPVDGKDGQLTTTVESYGQGLEQAFTPFADNCRNIDRIGRLPGTRNSKTGNMARVLHECSHNTPYPVGSFPRASDHKPAETPKDNDKAAIQIDWTKVKKPGWLKSAADLPVDAPRKLKVIIDHRGTLKELSEDLTEAGLINKRYGSWSDVTFALAAAFKHWARYSLEEIAEALMADLPCNRHITDNPDPHRAVERAINRSHDRKPATEGPCEPTIAVPTPERRKRLLGGIYDSATALDLLNSHYMIGKSQQETAIFRITDDNRLVFAPQKQFELEVANIFIQSSEGKHIPAEKFWTENPRRHQRDLVFKPDGTSKSSEYNLWRGFAVEPRKGWQKQRRLLRHILHVICCNDRQKFRYLMKWLAWTVQNPDKAPGTVIVLISRKQGAGKSTLGIAMARIFGEHGDIIDDRETLLGQFNDSIEHKSFILGEEILWAGDHRTTDKFKSRITAPTFKIERKFGSKRDIANKLHIMLTSNHDHAVAAGTSDRRLVVFCVSEKYAQDREWFDPLYADLEDGGYGEFLYLLQNVKLGDWHPRQQLKTAETASQQRMSADSVTHWAQACVEADEVVGDDALPLGERIRSEDLRQSHAWYCKQHGLRAANAEVFGTACTAMFGPKKRISAKQAEGKSRPWGYDVPDGDTWQKKIDERLGIVQTDPPDDHAEGADGSDPETAEPDSPDPQSGTPDWTMRL